MYGSSTESKKHEAIVSHCEAATVEVFMAGDVEHAKQVLRLWCKESPCCVTVTPTTFIYRGGEESGFVVGFRNYPRFPSDAEDIASKAKSLAERLRAELGQDSYMIVDGEQAIWSTTRQGG
jgi:hypothetical protein